MKGDASISPGLPESFNVLIRELQALCLDVDLIKSKKPVVEILTDETDESDVVTDADGEAELAPSAEVEA